MTETLAPLHKISLTRIKLHNFRNYETLDLSFGEKHIVLWGHNGAGKSNLLEAISLLSPGRGMRRASYQDMIKKGGEGFNVTAFLTSAQYGACVIATGVGSDNNVRKIRIDDISTSADNMADYARIVWIVPSMDGLFMGPASERRRFLDRMVLAIDPAHGKRVIAFEKVMRARNRLLQDKSDDEGLFAALEWQLAELGVAIAAARRDVVLRLRLSSQQSAHGAVFPISDIYLNGTLEQALEQEAALDVEEHYRRRLADNRALDRAAQRTLEGPHRSDFVVYHHETEVLASLCSTGEQKSLLIGLILCHVRLLTTITAMAPLILLDELAAHLDLKRRHALFSLLDSLGCQIFMSGSDKDLFEGLEERATFYEVTQAKIR